MNVHVSMACAMGFEHGVHSGTPVSADDARQVARVMSALATPSRVRILGRLREGPCSVGELTVAVEMEQPAVSHQLRILRDLGLVFGSRDGRHVIYGLYDSHVASLLDEALRHIDHLRLGAADVPRPAAAGTTAHRGAA
jgi:DNA-binding transcriptional ArsR family regulator